jgi:hypothetical protein
MFEMMLGPSTAVLRLGAIAKLETLSKPSMALFG